MKKLLAGLTLSTALLLSACGGEETPDTTEEAAPEETTEETAPEETTTEETAAGELQDGTYAIEELNFGDTGWKESLEITVAGGEITDATWTSVDEDGTNKREDEEYQEAMEPVSGVGPLEFIPELEESLVENQDPAAVEVVSGATGTSEKFQDYAQQLVDAAGEGNTETIEVDNPTE